MHAVQRVRFILPSGPYFRPAEPAPTGIPFAPSEFTSIAMFGWVPLSLVGSPPDWHRSALTDQRVTGEKRDWWRIPDFDPTLGDIKGIWEPSRFAWAIPFARRARAGDGQALDRLNAWIADWCENNPAYRGANWKCGQESSIRVMHLAMASVVIGQDARPLPALLGLIEAHLRRIAPTVSYAIGQDNNHGTSEAAALFIGGSMLARGGVHSGHAWTRDGRRLLERCVSRLVMADGTFSQYSVNYHRVLLDTVSMVELWRRRISEEQFSDEWHKRAKAATEWLRTLADPVTGEGPNIGANDGAHLLPISGTGASDLRPSIQLASALFCERWAYDPSGVEESTLASLGVEPPRTTAPAVGNRVFDDGGYVRLRAGSASLVMRYPRFTFRPSHADVLHVDLWVAGENLLRDGGSFRYHTDARWLRYFPGTESHNTVQFDGRDQMPRLGRFLFGAWLRANRVGPLGEDESGASFGAGYRDSLGAEHHRSIVLRAGSLDVRDQLSGKFARAVLRWRLVAGPWETTRSGATDGLRTIRIESDAPVRRMEITQGWESRQYGRKTPIPVLEVEVDQPALLQTVVTWAP